jgi:bifunctional UDP-N-acetylglucosamine pyrophosphorylase/glucosamine-1-phosphate N-acetyltransferase
MEKINIVILAGGLGKRMCSPTPKVLHLVHQVPMIVHVLQTAISLEPEKIMMVVGKYKNQIKQEIEKHITYPLLYIQQEEPLGTGHAVQQCVPHLNPNSKTIILSGDVPLIRTETIQNLILQTRVCGLIVSQVLNPTGLGRIVLNENTFEFIREEKDCREQEKNINLINAGIYCIKSNLIQEHIHKLESNNAQKEYYLTDLIGFIKHEHPIDLYILSKENNYEIMGINNPQELDQINHLSFFPTGQNRS